MSAAPQPVYIVGCGAVGTGLALALGDVGWPVAGLANRGKERRERAAALLGRPIDGAAFSDTLSQAGIVLVCVADDAIGAVGAALQASGRLHTGTVVAHTAGCLTSAALGGIDGAELASLHPLVACPDPERSRRALRAAVYALEGTPAGVDALQPLVRALGGRAVVLGATDKPRYHAAAVLAANLMVALAAVAIDEAEAAGLSDSTTALVDLAQGALEQVRALGPAKALTGPVLRGDVGTVRAHLQHLGPEALPVYRQLSRRALQIARERGLDPSRAQQIAALLAEAADPA